jgi:hypothetical protein
MGFLRGLYYLHFISDAQLKATPYFLKINLNIMKTLASLFATWFLSFTFLDQILTYFSSFYSVRATWPSSLPRFDFIYKRYLVKFTIYEAFQLLPDKSAKKATVRKVYKTYIDTL